MDNGSVLQALARMYMRRMRHMAEKHGLGTWLDDVLKANRRGECEATEKEVSMLSRLCDDERVARADIPPLLGKTYRACNDDDDFRRIKRLGRVGIYSKVSALLYGERLKNKRKNKRK